MWPCVRFSLVGQLLLYLKAAIAALQRLTFPTFRFEESVSEDSTVNVRYIGTKYEKRSATVETQSILLNDEAMTCYNDTIPQEFPLGFKCTETASQSLLAIQPSGIGYGQLPQYKYRILSGKA